MTSDADAPRKPLVCEVICGEALEGHVDEFRAWMALVWGLTVQALLSSGAIERPDDVYDKALWDGLVATGMPPGVKIRTRRLTAKAWDEMLRGDELRGFGVSAAPLPNVPEPPGAESSTIDISSDWQPHHIIPNSVDWALPARYTTGLDDAWVSRLVEGFVAFGTATRARAGLIGWFQPTRYTAYPQAKTDYRTVLWLPGWAMLLSDGHMTKLGGVAVLEGTGLFRPVERVGDGNYLVRSHTDLLDFDAAHLHEVESVLQPILLPPPYLGLDQS